MTRQVDRRSFLKGAAGAAAVLATNSLVPRIGFADPGPFESGVASGDPLPTAVILWTRVTPGNRPSVPVTWQISTDPRFPAGKTRGGTAVAKAARDFTVRIDAGARGSGIPPLRPGTTYYYRFGALGKRSVVGRTRTAPTDPARMRFAVASCQEYRLGYYNAWKHLATQDIDFVLFLGDYIYEYGNDPPNSGPTRARPHLPTHETVTLSDFRTRYRHYRGDPNLREAHRLFPFIAVWDDHEVANDRWGTHGGGSENHQANEGSFRARQAAGYQAYFEWMPIRRQKLPIYRSFRYGSLADLFVLDTRAHRDEPIGVLLTDPIANTNPAISDPKRTILGSAQKRWLKDGLRRSRAQWKLVGTQVMISHLKWGNIPDEVAQPLSMITGVPPLPPNKIHRDGIPVNHDQWDDYQPERREILEWIRNPGGEVSPVERVLGHPNRIKDVVFLTGDIHSTWFMETYVNPGDSLVEMPVAAEFVAPGIASESIHRYVGRVTVGQPLPYRSSVALEALAIANNPHMRFLEFDSNGYMVVDVDRERVRSELYFVTGPIGGGVPVEDPSSPVTQPIPPAWVVQAGSARMLPSP